MRRHRHDARFVCDLRRAPAAAAAAAAADNPFRDRDGQGRSQARWAWTADRRYCNCADQPPLLQSLRCGGRLLRRVNPIAAAASDQQENPKCGQLMCGGSWCSIREAIRLPRKIEYAMNGDRKPHRQRRCGSCMHTGGKAFTENCVSHHFQGPYGRSALFVDARGCIGCMLARIGSLSDRPTSNLAGSNHMFRVGAASLLAGLCLIPSVNAAEAYGPSYSLFDTNGV